MTGRWITGRLPERSGEYLVTTRTGCVCIAKFGYDLYKPHSWNGRFKDCVIAWQELPKAFRRE
ncbi:MAG: hypothetical protein II388_11085 [Clostridia bacterium]|nr:hypothetical protein [Clostridia bacterium]